MTQTAATATTIEYVTPDGDTVTGIVWSPGPLANSLWVLPYSGAPSSRAVVVKFPSKAEPKLHQVHYVAMVPIVQWWRLQERYAPKLSQKLWASVTTAPDQAELDLAAA